MTSPVATPRTLDEDMAELLSYGTAALAPTIHKAKERLALAATLWLDGAEPMDFDRFFHQVNEMPLFPRQRQFFADAGLIKALDFVTKGRKVSSLVGCWGKGSGKDLLAAAVTAYVAFINCSLAQDPSSHYGIAPYKRLSIINIAPTQKQARTVFFEYLLGFIKHPIFARFITDARRQIHADEIRFYRTTPYGAEYLCIGIYSMSSSAAGLEGHNVIWWTMDEADDFRDSAENSNADKLHRILQSSAASRFSGYWGGFVISYPRVEGGFLMRLLGWAKNDPSFHADLAATWEVNLFVSRDSPDIQSQYNRDPKAAAALYECIPMATSEAFFEFTEQVDAAVEAGRVPVAYVTSEILDLPSENGRQGHYVTALLGYVAPVPGHSYFLGGDAGKDGDAYALSIFHTDDTADATSYLCPRCGTPENRAFAPYQKQPTMTRVPYNEDIFCGSCYTTPFEFFEMAVVPGGTMRLDGWWVRGGGDQEPGEVVSNGRGQTYDLPHVYEDLLVQIRPVRAVRPGEVNRPVYFPGVRTLCQGLIEGLGIRKARFDPWNTAEITQGLIEATGRDVDQISFSGPDQYRRARLVKAMLYASRITLLPDAARDTEWKRLQRVGGSKVDHPKGVDGSKDLFDAEAVAIWCAATSKCNNLEVTWT